MVALGLSSILCFFVMQHLHANDIILGIRKDVVQLTKEEKDSILTALLRMKDTESKYDSSYSAFDYFAYVHKYAFENSRVGAQGHNRWSFLPWHRAFSYLFEKELQEIMNDTSFRLPYWDVTNEVSTHETLLDETFLGGDGDENNNNIIINTSQLNCNNFPINPR